MPVCTLFLSVSFYIGLFYYYEFCNQKDSDRDNKAPELNPRIAKRVDWYYKLYAFVSELKSIFQYY